MSLTLASIAANAALDAIDDLLNTTSAGYCQFQSTGSTNLANIALASTAFGAATGSSMTVDTTSLSNTNCTAGTMTKLAFYNTNNTLIFSIQTSTATATDYIQVSDETLEGGETIEITSFKLSAAGQ